eukprot:759450-Hanusia_phi.AAC.3
MLKRKRSGEAAAEDGREGGGACYLGLPAESSGWFRGGDSTSLLHDESIDHVSCEEVASSTNSPSSPLPPPRSSLLPLSLLIPVSYSHFLIVFELLLPAPIRPSLSLPHSSLLPFASSFLPLCPCAAYSVGRWREEAEKFREEHGAAQLQEDFLDRLQELHALLAASLNAVREPATYRRVHLHISPSLSSSSLLCLVASDRREKLADAEAAGRAAAARAVEERGGDEVEGSEGEGMEGGRSSAIAQLIVLAEDKMLEEDRDDIQLLPGEGQGGGRRAL